MARLLPSAVDASHRRFPARGRSYVEVPHEAFRSQGECARRGGHGLRSPQPSARTGSCAGTGQRHRPRASPAPALCPQSRPPRSCSICVCSWLGRSRSHCHSRNPQSESHRVSVQTTHEWPSPSPPVLGRGRLHGWGLCFSCISAALLFPRLDHHRGPSLPHDAPLLEPYPPRQHQVGLSEGVCVCLCTGWLTTATPPPPTFTRMHSVCQRTPRASLLESGDAIALGTPTPGRVQCSGTQPGSPCQPAWMEPCEPGHTTCLSLGSHFCGWEESRACPRLSGPCWLRRLLQKAGRGGLMGPGGRSRLASGTAGRRDSRCRLDLVSLPLASVLLCRLMSRKALHGGTVGSRSVTPTWV